MKTGKSRNEPMRILGIVAHPDDEIGMVGTLKNHSARGDKVFLAWMTRGELISVFDPAEYSLEDVAAIRTNQAKETACLVGAKPVFLDFPDSNVPDSRDAALKVAELIRKTRPTAIITWDSQVEGHPDHRNTGKLVLDASIYARIPRLLPDIPAYRPKYESGINIYTYGYTSNPAPKIYIDISEAIDIVDQISQIYNDIFPMDIKKWKYHTTKRYGQASGCEFAEMFHFKRYKGTFASLVREDSNFATGVALPPENKAVQYLI
ncbi:MAG: PIG-L deacetylase family protein [Candidatus Heimdallarchaeota archaeon]